MDIVLLMNITGFVFNVLMILNLSLPGNLTAMKITTDPSLNHHLISSGTFPVPGPIRLFPTAPFRHFRISICGKDGYYFDGGNFLINFIMNQKGKFFDRSTADVFITNCYTVGGFLDPEKLCFDGLIKAFA